MPVLKTSPHSFDRFKNALVSSNQFRIEFHSIRKLYQCQCNGTISPTFFKENLPYHIKRKKVKDFIV